MTAYNPVVRWLARALREYADEEAPVTYALLGLILGIYLIEVGYVYAYDLEGTAVFASGLFGVAPLVAWPLAPVLHNDVFHLIGSVGGGFVLGVPLEHRLTRRRYVALILVSAYISTLAGVAVMAVFADGALAFYGASGIVFAMAGYAVTIPWQPGSIRSFEWMAILLGALSLGTLLMDPLTGPYFSPHWINGGHLAGFALGLLYAKTRS
ncbi:MAG: rhomboid family intramembrane serine protease [Halanaeroarchaeum sp.]